MFDTKKFHPHANQIAAGLAEMVRLQQAIVRAEADSTAGADAEAAHQALEADRTKILGDAYIAGTAADTKAIDAAIKKAAAASADARERANGARAALVSLRAQLAAAQASVDELEQADTVADAHEALRQAREKVAANLKRHTALIEEQVQLLAETWGYAGVAHDLTLRLKGREGPDLGTLIHRLMGIRFDMPLPDGSYVHREGREVVAPLSHGAYDAAKAFLVEHGVFPQGRSLVPETKPQAPTEPRPVTISTTRPDGGLVITQASVDQNGKDVGAVGLISSELR
jgi:hypothetical protein